MPEFVPRSTSSELLEFLVADFDSGLEANNTLALAGFDSDLGFGANEVGLAPGDSGGPVFIGGAIAGVSYALDGNPRLIGTGQKSLLNSPAKSAKVDRAAAHVIFEN